MERAGGVKGSRWLSLEQVASPQAAATAPETSAVFWSPSWDSMAAAVGQGAACELDPGPAPRPCCSRGCHHPASAPDPPRRRQMACPSAVPLALGARPGPAGEGRGTGRSRASPCRRDPAPSELHAVNRRVEASRLGQGVAFWLELVSRVRARRTCLCRRLASLMGGGS